jgi:hypothetical protein
MVLCFTHGLDAAQPANADERWLGTNFPAGTPS